MPELRAQHLMLPGGSFGRDVHLWQFGWWGYPVLVFPTAAGFAHEWQREGMVEALTPLLAAGRIKLYCPESNVAEAWTREGDPTTKLAKHSAYERWILDILVPYIRRDCNWADARIATAGSSLGAMYAGTFALKHPEVFHWALCMSGRYRSSHFLGGFRSAEAYFNDPLAFVPNLQSEALDRIREKTHLVLVCGQGAWEEGCIDETRELCGWLTHKGISHDCDIWGRDVAHDWTWWRRQARHHLSRRFA